MFSSSKPNKLLDYFLFLHFFKKSELNVADALPPEMLIKIFSYLNETQLIKAGRISTSWNKVSADDALWRQFTLLSKTSYLAAKKQAFDAHLVFNNEISQQQIAEADWLWKSVNKKQFVYILGKEHSHKYIIFENSSERFHGFNNVPTIHINKHNYVLQTAHDKVSMSRADMALIFVTNADEYHFYLDLLKKSDKPTVFFLFVVKEDQAKELNADTNSYTLILRDNDDMSSLMKKVNAEISRLANINLQLKSKSACSIL